MVVVKKAVAVGAWNSKAAKMAHNEGTRRSCCALRRCDDTPSSAAAQEACGAAACVMISDKLLCNKLCQEGAPVQAEAEWTAAALIPRKS